MSTDPESTKHKRYKIIQSIKNAVSLATSRTREKMRMLLNRPKIHTFSAPPKEVITGELTILRDYQFEIFSINQIYALSRNLPIEDVIAKSIPNELHIGPLEGDFQDFADFKINHTIKKQRICPLEMETKSYERIIFNAAFGLLTPEPFKETTPRQLEIKTFKKPQFFNEKHDFKANILQRSKSFPINLPIERAPLSLLLFSEPELKFFKLKLAEKFNLNWRLIKITSLYNKLNVKNIQNIKLDHASEKVFFTFKPKTNQAEEHFAYMITGRRNDTNQMLSLMVSEFEYREFKSEYIKK